MIRRALCKHAQQRNSHASSFSVIIHNLWDRDKFYAKATDNNRDSYTVITAHQEFELVIYLILTNPEIGTTSIFFLWMSKLRQSDPK